jgi:hypothetical protein
MLLEKRDILRKINLTQFDFMFFEFFFGYFELLNWFVGVLKMLIKCFGVEMS